MLPDNNPPLRVGQILKRRANKFPCPIVGADVSPSGMVWLVDLGELFPRRMTLSEVYREFEFPN